MGRTLLDVRVHHFGFACLQEGAVLGRIFSHGYGGGAIRIDCSVIAIHLGD